jgi:hypothetical protein
MQEQQRMMGDTNPYYGRSRQEDNAFQRECIERLTRLEGGLRSIKADIAGWKTKVVVIASALGAFVAGALNVLKGH